LDYWNRAYDSVIARAGVAPEKPKIVAFHPSYYSARRSEFYSTLSQPIARKEQLNFDHVVLLIDDIYDIQRRLGTKGDIYDLERRLSRHLLSQKLDRFLRPLDEMDATERLSWVRLRAENLNATLSDISAWRRFDMVQAELLARAHECRLTVFGVKHPFRSLRQLLTDPSGTKTAYLSHPISRPRRAMLNGTVADWPQVVVSSNRLGDRLAPDGIDLVMPTAIDEFRVQPAPDAAAPFSRPYRLGVRWPELSPTGAILPNPLPADLALEVEPDIETELGEYARALEKTIIGEVPFRDHFLVSNTDAFFVYRPLFGVKASEDTSERGGSFSGGVQAEIDHWVDSWITEPAAGAKRRALFAHSLSDIEEVAWLWAGGEPNDEDERRLHSRGLEQALRKHLREKYGLRHQDVESVLQGSALRDDMLDGAIIDASHDLPSLRASMYEDAGRNYLVQYLTGGIERGEILESGDVAILLFDHEELSDEELRNCAQFLRGESPWATSFVDPASVILRGLGVTTVEEWVSALLAIA
jgi:hypothetical protein